MASIFNINWSTVVENLTPYFWRTTSVDAEAKLIPYLRSMISPVQTISDELLALRTATFNFLNYNGQHKVLEEYLNDTYDFTLRRITITENDIAGIDPITIYLADESTDDPLELYLSGEVPPTAVGIYLADEAIADDNFTVNIPVGVVYNADTLDAQLRNYIEASKNYNVVTF